MTVCDNRIVIFIFLLNIITKTLSVECHVCSLGDIECGDTSRSCQGQWCVSIWVKNTLWSSGCITGYNQVWAGCFEISPDQTICACKESSFCADLLPPDEQIYHVVPTVTCHNKYGRLSSFLEESCQGSACFMGALRKWSKDGNEPLETEYQQCLQDPIPAIQAYATTITGLGDLDTCYILKFQIDDELYDQYSCICTSNLCNSGVMENISPSPADIYPFRCQVAVCSENSACKPSAYCTGQMCIYGRRVSLITIVEDYELTDVHIIKGCVQASRPDALSPKHVKLEIGKTSVYEAWYCNEEECNQDLNTAKQSILRYQLNDLLTPP